MRTSQKLRIIVAFGAVHINPANHVAASQEPDFSLLGQEQPRPEEEQPRQPQQDPPDTRTPWPSLSIIAVDLETDVSTKTSREFILSPSTISVIKETEIQWSGVRYVSDLLRLVPGLEVQRILSTSSNVSVRGYNDNPTASQGVLALIDGRQVYNEWLGSPLWDQLMLIPEDIKEVQVIRGPGSFLYGPNAMHGVVNFVRKSPLDYTENEASLTGAFGTYGSAVSRLRLVERDRQAGSGLMATFVYDDIDDFESRGADIMDRVYGEIRYEKDLGGGSRGDSAKSDHRFELGAGTSDQKFELLIPTFLPPVPPDLYFARSQETYATGKYTNGGLEVRATWAAFDSSAAAQFYAPANFNLDTIDLNAHHSFELLQNNKVTVGLGHRRATIDSENPDISLGRHTAHLSSVFVQDEVTLIPEELFLTAGMGLDEHSKAGSNTAPRAALVWRWTESQSLRASYGRGHRNPSLGETWRRIPVTLPFGTVTLVGNEDLEAEKMESYELGYRGWFKENRVRVGVTGFLNYVEDIVKLEQVGPVTVAPLNVGDERVHGIEIDGEYGFSESLSSFGNYAYRHREDRLTGDRVPLGPESTANLGFRYSANAAIPGGNTVDVMAWVTFFDDTEFNFVGGEVDEYVILNASVSYNFLHRGTSRGSTFLKAFNVLDNEHRENPEGDEIGLILQAGFRLTF